MAGVNPADAGRTCASGMRRGNGMGRIIWQEPWHTFGADVIQSVQWVRYASQWTFRTFRHVPAVNPSVAPLPSLGAHSSALIAPRFRRAMPTATQVRSPTTTAAAPSMQGGCSVVFQSNPELPHSSAACPSTTFALRRRRRQKGPPEPMQAGLRMPDACSRQVPRPGRVNKPRLRPGPSRHCTGRPGSEWRGCLEVSWRLSAGRGEGLEGPGSMTATRPPDGG